MYLCRVKRILGITIICCLAVLGMAQQSGNPFDLTFRKPSPVKPPAEQPAETLAVPTKNISPVDEKSPVEDAPPVEKAERESIKHAIQDTTTDIGTGAGGNNPFDLKASEEFSAATPEIKAPSSDPEPKAVEEKSSNSKVKKPSKAEKRSEPDKSTSGGKGFQIFFVLLSLLFLIFIVNVERSFIRELWRVITNENYSSLHLRNQRNTMRQILLLMGYVVFVMQAGLFLYHALRFFGLSGSLFDNIWTCMGLVLAIYLIRHAGIFYLRWLFNNEKEMTLFGFDISIFNIMVGLILLPVNILILFGPENLLNVLIFTGVGIIALAYLLRQLRWSFNASHLITRSLFLFFIYLCAVEILPLWAISKLFW